MDAPESLGFLEQALDELHLPASVRAAARALDLRTLRDLAATNPSVLRARFAVAQRDLHAVAHLIRSRAGCPWRQVYEALNPGAASATPIVPDVDPVLARWAALGQGLPAELRVVPLGALAGLNPMTSANLQRHGVETVGELLSRPAESLLALHGFGPKSLAAAAASIASYLAHARGLEEEASLDSYPRLSSFWTVRAKSLPTRESLVLAQRDGLDCPARRTDDLASSMGVSRVRVGQLERGALAQMTRDGRWVDALDARLRRALPDGPRAVDAVVAEDPWLADLRDAPAFARYVFRRVLGGRYALREEGGVATLTRHDAGGR